MYRDKTVLCFILARGGSKGVPRKNVKILCRKPLIAHSIDVAKKVKYIDATYVSTEDNEIKQAAIKYGAKVIDRPKELATDTASYLDTVKHMIETIPIVKKNLFVVLLETTSPIRKISDVEQCIEMYDDQTDCVAAVREVKVHPNYMYKEKDGFLHSYEKLTIVKNRQEMEKLYAYTGSILVTTSDFIKKQKKVVFGGRMKGYLLEEKQAMDIDSPLDFAVCEFLMTYD